MHNPLIRGAWEELAAESGLLCRKEMGFLSCRSTSNCCVLRCCCWQYSPWWSEHTGNYATFFLLSKVLYTILCACNSLSQAGNVHGPLALCARDVPCWVCWFCADYISNLQTKWFDAALWVYHHLWDPDVAALAVTIIPLLAPHQLGITCVLSGF